MKAVCVTLDIDWAHDLVIHEALDLLAQLGIRATLFITHKTPTLGRMADEGHEIGLHPNFNPLLAGEGGCLKGTIESLQHLVPEARSIRSHSLVRSTRISQLFAECGLTHESNIFVPEAAGHIKPWLDPFGLTQVPIRWEDDLYCVNKSLGTTASSLEHCDLLVCDFHPIHLFLNTVDMADYENTRHIHQDPETLRHYCRPAGSGGSRDQLVSLVASRGSFDQKCIGDIRVEDNDK